MTFSVYSLFSGSSANATLIRAGADAILIDAGGSLRRIRAALESVGCPIEAVRAIFITHEHSDHIAALPMIAKYHKIPIHMVRGSLMAAERCLSSIDPALITAHPPRFEAQIGPMSVRSFCTSHDSAASVGYTVSVGGLRFGLATDTGVLTDEIVSAMVGCDLALIEANHDPGMLRTGPYPPELKARIRSDRGHLSNSQSADLAAALAESGARAILLAHLSAENNTPAIALKTVSDRLTASGFSPALGVATRCAVTPLAVDWEIPEPHGQSAGNPADPSPAGFLGRVIGLFPEEASC